MGIELEWNIGGVVNSSIKFKEGSPVIGEYLLLDYDGLDSNLLSPVTQKSPFQVGQSIIGANVEPRVITMSVLVNGGTENLMHIKMKELSKALAVTPVRPGETQWYGNIYATITENGVAKKYKIGAMPVNSPQFVSVDGEGLRGADLEFFCPRPYWESYNAYSSGTVAAGTTKTITTAGDVETPAYITINGPCTDPIITNVTTGEKIAFSINLLSNEYIAIDTQFGSKSVIKQVSGSQNTTNALGNVKFAESTFFQLQPGSNQLKLTTPNGNYGTFTCSYYDRFSGIGA